MLDAKLYRLTNAEVVAYVEKLQKQKGRKRHTDDIYYVKTKHGWRPKQFFHPDNVPLRPVFTPQLWQETATTNFEWLFSDSPPHWSVGGNGKSSQTAEEAGLERQRVVRLLGKYNNGHDHHGVLKRLAASLTNCHSNVRCMSSVCPVCRRGVQRCFVDSMNRWAGERTTKTFKIVTIVPRLRLMKGDLDLASKISKFRKHLDNAFKAAGIVTVIGAFDISANEYEQLSIRNHYRLHVWCFIPAKQVDRGIDVLRRYFSRNESIKRPIKVQSFDGNIKAFAYGMKENFQRRDTHPKVVDSKGRTIHRQYVKPRKLRTQQEIDFAIMLDQISLLGRMYLRSVQLPDMAMFEKKSGDRGKKRLRGAQPFRKQQK